MSKALGYLEVLLHVWALLAAVVGLIPMGPVRSYITYYIAQDTGVINELCDTHNPNNSTNPAQGPQAFYLCLKVTFALTRMTVA